MPSLQRHWSITWHSLTDSLVTLSALQVSKGDFNLLPQSLFLPPLLPQLVSSDLTETPLPQPLQAFPKNKVLHYLVIHSLVWLSFSLNFHLVTALYPVGLFKAAVERRRAERERLDLTLGMGALFVIQACRAQNTYRRRDGAAPYKGGNDVHSPQRKLGSVVVQ